MAPSLNGTYFMKKKPLLIIGLFMSITCAGLIFHHRCVEGATTEPPVLDREVFFGNPNITNAKISPDGQSIAFLQPYNGILNIWVTQTGQPMSQARPVTMIPKRPIGSYFWTRDSRYILFLQDQGGDENFHLFAVNPSSTAAPRDLSQFDRVRVRLFSLPKSLPNTVFVGMNDRDERYHDIYKINIDTGERTLVRQNDDCMADAVFDLAGNLRALVKVEPDGSIKIFALDGAPPRCIAECSKHDEITPLRFHKDGKRLYVVSNKGDDADCSGLLLLNVETGETEIVDSDPEHEVDFDGPIFSNKTDELVATVYVGDRQRVYWKNPEWKKKFQTLQASLPGGEIVINSITSDDSLMTVTAVSDVDPGRCYLYNRTTGHIDFLYATRPSLPSECLSTMKPITYTTRDGLAIHGYLTTPKGVKPQNLPLVVYPHGGPWSRDYWGYQGMVQFLANRGYAVLQMNFRGSSGYGKQFLNAGNKEWGDAMQNDITDGVHCLIQQGIVDPKRVAIHGGSYGGYATLAGLAFTPDLYAAGISYVGPSNLLTLLSSFPAYWIIGKGQMDERVGNLDDPIDVDRLKRQSPLFSVQNISAPLLVVQGANDPRVKKAESDQIVVALRSLGRQVEYLVASDEGHGFASPTNRLAFSTATEFFLAKHLGGRCQKEVPETISQQLQAISVDVASVQPVAVEK